MKVSCKLSMSRNDPHLTTEVSVLIQMTTLNHKFVLLSEVLENKLLWNCQQLPSRELIL